MKIAVMGAGGVGGYFGGLLARAGEEVHFIARGEHLLALRERGLRVKSAIGNFELKVSATDSPQEVGRSELILFCVKGYDTERASRLIEPMVGPDTAVISLQNGIDNEEILSRILGEEHVLGGLCYIFSVIEASGVISQTAGPRTIIFGELRGGRSRRGERFLKTFERAEINAELSEDILSELWQKFLMICPLAGMTAIARATVGEVLGLKETEEMLLSLMREVRAVALAREVNLPDDAIDKAMGIIRGLAPSSKSSLLHDLEGGRRLEVETLSGALSRYGKEAGVPTPINDLIYSALKLEDERRRRA
ncbi:MAG: 2-dehydropantoate 2-reductase [Nitrospinota bacterium]